MAYPQHLLNEDESVRLDMKPHWWFFVKYIMSGFLILVALVAFVVGKSKLDDNILNGSLESIVGFALIGVVLLWIFGLIVRYYYWRFTLFVVTSDRVIFRTGIIAKKGTEIPLESISNINFNQTIVERIVGCGTLNLESAGIKDDLTFSHIRNPDLVQREIYVMMEDNVKKTAQYSSAGMYQQMENAMQHSDSEGQNNKSNSGDIIAQIESLAGLRDKNLISDAEYEQKKRDLLDRM